MCAIFNPSIELTFIQEGSDVDALTDKEICRLYGTGSTRIGAPSDSLALITPNTVGKRAQDKRLWSKSSQPLDSSEANALNIVLTQTTIPVPRVHRLVKTQHAPIIVMDYIRGSTLAELWPTMTIWRKFGVAITLRRYVRQLRRLKATASTPPGPPSKSGPRKIISPIWGQILPYRGPFATHADFSDWFNQRAIIGHDAKGLPLNHPARKIPFDASEPLVLVHQDINPRNIIVGEDDQLWLIDWAWAGYLPPWFEYLAMLEQDKNERRGKGAVHHKHWDTLIPFICGPYFKEKDWIASMAWAFRYR
jgi:hypothetical protein